MKPSAEPDFNVHDCIITKDVRTELVLAIGGTDQVPERGGHPRQLLRAPYSPRPPSLPPGADSRWNRHSVRANVPAGTPPRSPARSVVRHRNHSTRRRNPVAPRIPPQIHERLQPRLTTVLFRRYLRACVCTGPNQSRLLAGAQLEAADSPSPRTGHFR